MNYNNILGNEEVKEYLNVQVKNNNVVHSYLFSGIDAIGKKMFAEVFAKNILCYEGNNEFCKCKSCVSFIGENHPDFILINKNSETIKIEQIRELTNKIIEKPIVSSKKVYIINDAEKMTKEAQNCLLKTLEEPPEFAVLILITSNENLLLTTVKSRCMKINFHAISNEEMRKYCEENLGYHNIELERIKSFEGSIGKAIKFIENEAEYKQIEELIEEISKNNISTVLSKAKILYNKEKVNEYLNYMISYLYNKQKKNSNYLHCIEHVNECINKLKYNGNLDMNVDMMFIKMWEILKK